MSETTLQKRIDELVRKHGTLRAAAKAVGVSTPYLCRIRSGLHPRLSEETQLKLGVRRMPDVYVRRGR